jgi:nickel-dependent lactate racemase
MPALGTHRPLGPEEIAFMFPACPPDKFLPHRWREDTVELGRLESGWVEAAFTGPDTGGQDTGKRGAGGLSGETFRGGWPVQVNRILRDGLPPCPGAAADPFSLIISIGQVVPHEIAGMANHAKNVFIGTGGAEAINKSHYLGALYGLERIMGRAETPVRALFDEAFRRYGNLLPPVLWVLTVVDFAGTVRGLFSGFGRDCFEKAAALSEQLNITRLGEAVGKIVVWLSPHEYRSMWLGNKAVYRSRMAIARGGELVILAPGLERFGEDSEIDALIRRYGYLGAEKIRRAVEAEADPARPDGGPSGLAASLSAAAHLIHGSSEGRFTVRYCTDPGRGLGREAIEKAGYEWGNPDEAIARYVPELKSFRQSGPDRKVPATGWRTAANGERFYFIANPALGLWRV